MVPVMFRRSAACLALAFCVVAGASAQVAPTARPHHARIVQCLQAAQHSPAASLEIARDLLAASDLNGQVEAGALGCKTLALHTLGQGDEALATIERLLPLVEQPGFPVPFRLEAYLQASTVLMATSQQQRALDLLETALQEARRHNEGAATLSALMGIGIARASQLDDAAGAVPYFEQALAELAKLPSSPPMREAGIRYNLGYALLTLKRYAQADAEFQRIQRLLGPAMPDQGMAARLESHRGEILRLTGHPHQARPKLEAAMAVQERIGDIHGQTVTLMRLARLALEDGALETAQSQAEHALTLAERGRFVLETRDALELLVTVNAARGDTVAAARHSERIQAMERERDRTGALDKLARMQAEVEKEIGPGGTASQDVRRAQLLRDGSIVLMVLILLVGGTVLARMRRRQRQLRVRGSTDALTGLLNRGEADLRIQAMVQAHPGDEQRRCVLLMIDIDAFKAINDQHGHAVGDEALKHVARILREASDSNDLVARWGGEEFLVARADSQRDAAFALAEHLRASIERQPLTVAGGTTLGLSVSIGVTPCPFFPDSQGHDGWQNDLRLADRALYVAKRSGRNAWAGLWGLPEGRDVDLYSVRQNPQTALAQGWIVIGGNRPMSWAPIRDDSGESPRSPASVQGSDSAATRTQRDRR